MVLTLYGTEIWHYTPRRFGVDLFTRAYASASHVTFYSRGLLDRAVELGLSRERLTVVYPPVAEYFSRVDERRDSRRGRRSDCASAMSSSTSSGSTRWPASGVSSTPCLPSWTPTPTPDW